MSERWTICVTPNCPRECMATKKLCYVCRQPPVEVVPASELEALAAKKDAVIEELGETYRMQYAAGFQAQKEAAETALAALRELVEAVEARVLRTPELTAKQQAIEAQFGDEAPQWAQLGFLQSEIERMREELRAALTTARELIEP